MRERGVGAGIAKVVGIVILVIFLLVSAGSSFFTLNEDTQAVVTTFGQPKLVSAAGLHFKIPYIQQVRKVNTSIKGFPIGYVYSGDSEDAENSTTSVDDESLMITKDYNFVNVDFYISYQITDPIAALYATEDCEVTLKNMAQNCIRSTVASYNVDSVLTNGKNEIQANIKEMLIAKLDKYDIGITLKDVSIQDSEPPTAEVSNAFKAVESAKQGRETAINNANKYANEIIPKAEADADEIIQKAEAEKTSTINDATGQTARFNSLYEEYKNYPLITKQRMFYETMEELLPDMKVIIENSDGTTQTVLPLESFTGESSTSGQTTPSSDTSKKTDNATEKTE